MKGNAKAPRFQGAGTLVVNPTKLDNAYDEFVKLLGHFDIVNIALHISLKNTR